MNFSPLQLRKPALAALGERAENLFRDHHYRECTQVMRQFAEGVLRTILKDDRHTYSEMMRTPLVRQLADSLTFEYFRRIRDLGNEASHFRLGTSGTMLETGERHYRVRTADDAAECLKYGHGIAVWLMSLLDREFRYPDFRPLTPRRAPPSSSTPTSRPRSSSRRGAISCSRRRAAARPPSSPSASPSRSRTA